jgi:hypothetical protein
MDQVKRTSGTPQGVIARLVVRVRSWLRRRLQKEEPNIYPFF